MGDYNCMVHKNVFTGITYFDLWNSPERAAEQIQSLSQYFLANK